MNAMDLATRNNYLFARALIGIEYQMFRTPCLDRGRDVGITTARKIPSFPDTSNDLMCSGDGHEQNPKGKRAVNPY